MSRVSTTIYWLIANSVLAYLLWAGWIEGLEGPRNLVVFYAGAMCVLAVLVLSVKPSQQPPEAHGVPGHIRGAAGLAVIGFLVCTAHGWQPSCTRPRSAP